MIARHIFSFNGMNPTELHIETRYLAARKTEMQQRMPSVDRQLPHGHLTGVYFRTSPPAYDVFTSHAWQRAFRGPCLARIDSSGCSSLHLRQRYTPACRDYVGKCIQRRWLAARYHACELSFRPKRSPAATFFAANMVRFQYGRRPGTL